MIRGPSTNCTPVRSASEPVKISGSDLDAAGGIRPGKPYRPHKVAQIFFHVWPGETNVQESLFPRVPTTLIDISDVAAFFNYTNRMAHALDMMPNPEYHAMNR